MASSAEVDEEELQIALNIRQKFFEDHGQDLSHFDDQDLERIKTDDSYVCAFVRHRKKDSERALDMMVSCLKWRKLFGINTLTERTIDRRLFESGFLFHHNFDKEGHPIIIFLGKLHKKDPQCHPELKRFLAFGLEKMSRQYSGKRVTLIFDMQETGLANMDMDFVKFIINCFNNYFPCMLAWLIVLEMPWILSAAWKLVKTWLPPEGINKIKFVNKTEMLQYIHPDQLLVKHGGTDPFEYTYPPSPYEPVTPPPMLSENGVLDYVSSSDIPDPRESSIDLEDFTDSKKVVRFVSAADDSFFSSGNPEIIDEEDGSSMHLKLRYRGSSIPKRQNMSSESVSNKPSLLTFSPSDELIFIGRTSSDAEIQQSFTLTNSTESIVAFKVKTTSPESYRVRPSSGIVSQGSSSEVNVFLQPGHAASVQKDKFLVMSTVVHTNDLTATQLAALWKTLSKSNISEHRLRCKYAAVNPQTVVVETKTQEDRNHEAINSLKLTLIDIERKVDTANTTLEQLEQRYDTMFKLQIALLTIFILLIALLVYAIRSDKSLIQMGLNFPRFLTSNSELIQTQFVLVFVVLTVVLSLWI